ncbi:hypothetical protein Nepgr_032922 [Nepenthes gracilis]|uniref:Caffeoyl-CoA O-methyltransferase n=1 Tax=Nepenthes gracilis TaxID=150966 RepID=A0AAD3Y894_NEPGR|nr:hypothetical protein Nepgr_032922 [Nepenthes gracilis]
MDSSLFTADLPCKSLLQSEALLEYILRTSSYPQELELLKQLREATVKKYNFKSVLTVPIDEAQFLGMLLKVMNAKKTLEVGVFTGYSIITTALALPEDGKVVGIDPDREAYEVGVPFIKKAGVEHKIHFIEADGMSGLKHLLENGEEGTFDFIFMDADKDNYINYHDMLLKLVRVGGLIGYDNTLWFGTVALDDEAPLPEVLKRSRGPLLELNSALTADPRIESTILSIGDGITLCRRLY